MLWLCTVERSLRTTQGLFFSIGHCLQLLALSATYFAVFGHEGVKHDCGARANTLTFQKFTE